MVALGPLAPFPITCAATGKPRCSARGCGDSFNGGDTLPCQGRNFVQGPNQFALVTTSLRVDKMHGNGGPWDGYITVNHIGLRILLVSSQKGRRK